MTVCSMAEESTYKHNRGKQTDTHVFTFYGVLSLFLQFYKTARECLALAEIGDCLQCSPDPRSEATLLGVTQEDINRHHPHKKVR